MARNSDFLTHSWRELNVKVIVLNLRRYMNYTKMITGYCPMYKRLNITLLLFLLAGWTLPGNAQESEPGHDDGSRSCINTRLIRRTYIVDDRNVLFYMSGGTVFHNILRMPCHGLEREDRFSYHTTGAQLCRLDGIYVLYNGAWGLREGASCSLGDFHEISKETAEAMRETPQQPQTETAPLPMPAPEQIGVDENGPPEAAEPAEPEEPQP
jgi:hypothetical protein